LLMAPFQNLICTLSLDVHAGPDCGMFDMVCDAIGRKAGAGVGGASAGVALLAAPFKAWIIVIL
jgi:hypothetical protein